MSECPHCELKTAVFRAIKVAGNDSMAMGVLVEVLADLVVSNANAMTDVAHVTGMLVWNIQAEVCEQAGDLAAEGDLRFLSADGVA